MKRKYTCFIGVLLIVAITSALLTESLYYLDNYAKLNAESIAEKGQDEAWKTVDVITSTIWEDENKIFDETVRIPSGVNLTIINSDIDFNNTENGFVVDGGILDIRESTIHSGDKGIEGETNGTLIIKTSEIYNMQGDCVNIEGDYKINIAHSTFSNSDKDGVDFTDISEDIVVTNSAFDNLGKDGFNIEEVAFISIENTVISNVGDEGIQIDASEGFTVSNVSISTCGGDGIKSRDMQEGAVIHMEKLSIQGCADDGIQVYGIHEVELLDSVLTNNQENGYESDNVALTTISNVNITNNGIQGIELIELGEIALTDVVISNNEIGVYLENITKFTLENSILTNSEKGGMIAINVTEADAHYNVIKSNDRFAINASGLLEGQVFNATYNYWGTTNASAVLVIGNVLLEPILDENMDVYQTEKVNIVFISILAALGIISIYRRKK